jgi:outer membrane protein assembly factor BamE (lipoprotein component of BamABCDE complex)
MLFGLHAVVVLLGIACWLFSASREPLPVRAGMTRAEVEAILGPPRFVESHGGGSNSYYVKEHSTTVVCFDRNGVAYLADDDGASFMEQVLLAFGLR